MFDVRQFFPVAVALFLAGIVPGAGQAAFPAPAQAPQPPAMPEQNNPAAAGPAKPGAAPSSTLQTKKAPRTPTAASLGSPAAPPAVGTTAAVSLLAPTFTPAGNAAKIIRVYRGPGHFDEKLAGQLKLALQQAFGAEPDSKNQPGDGPGSPTGAGTGPGRIARNNSVKVH